MNCAPYAALATAEQADLLAHVIIAIQTDENCFKLARAIYGIADVAGVYEKARPHVDAAALHDLANPIE